MQRIVLLPWLLVGVLAGCGADDESTSGGAAAADVQSDTSVTDVAGEPTWTVTLSGATTGPRVAMAVDGPDDAGTFTLRVTLRDIPDLFGIATHLRYDPTQVELVDAKEHAVLAGDGWAPRVLLKPVPERVLLGAARIREGGSPYSPLEGAKVGNQLWATLQFRLLDAATSATIDFDPARSIARSAGYEVLTLDWASVQLQRGAAGGR
ncbi:MAG: hypothetical protein RIT45_2679 [Pseudomonadota bacterium]|jgi:hypothetical protein